MIHSSTDIGVLLPHFGSAARRELIRVVASAAAEHGLQPHVARE